ncbi:MAG TPA: adenylyl-sulfate kinase [Methylomirabilota bacterium]
MSWAIWITGPPASGKSTIARAVTAELRARAQPVTWLDLDEVRASITPDPRDSDAERDLVYRALGYLATLLVEAGRPVVIDATAHRRVWRDLVRAAVPRFAEVQLVCPVEVCRAGEGTRTTGDASRNIYASSRRPGAAMPGVDVPYEAALAPELLIDTAAGSLASAAERVVALAECLIAQASAAGMSVDGGEEAGWAIWITGRPGSGKTTLAQRVLEALRERGLRVRLLELDPVQRILLGRRATSQEEQDVVHRVLAYAAKLLTEAGASAIVDATAGRRAWRQTAGDLIASFAEIQLLCPVEICLERERALRRGLTFEAGRVGGAAGRPDIEMAYEESIRPDLAVWTDVCDVESATEQVLATIERLAGRFRPAKEAR